MNTHFKSWQAMFVFIGLATALIGIATFFILPDSPMKSKWLSDTEKAALLKHVSINQTGVENRHFKMSQVVEVVRDLQLWLMTICTICVRMPTAVSIYLPNSAYPYYRSPFQVVSSQRTHQHSFKALASLLSAHLSLICLAVSFPLQHL
jgi:hypothetical protein